MTEEKIIQGLLEKDPAVHDAVFKELYRTLYYFAFNIISNQPDAEDLVVDCFTNLWVKPVAFDSLEGVRKYLFVAVKNRCLTYLRKRQRKDIQIIDMNSPEEIEPKENVELVWKTEEIEAQSLDELYRAILNLPERCRYACVLTYFEGMSRKEVAQRMNISEHTVKNQIANALNLLRDSLVQKKYAITYFVLFIANLP